MPKCQRSIIIFLCSKTKTILLLRYPLIYDGNYKVHSMTALTSVSVQLILITHGYEALKCRQSLNID